VRALLYRPSWQALRVSFLKENRNDGGWTTATGTEANLYRLVDYVSLNAETVDEFALEAKSMGYGVRQEEAVRLYRAINCLNAVRMGNSGQGDAGSSRDQVVLEVRDSFQRMQTPRYHEFLTYASVRWDWRVVKQELQVEYDKGNMHGRFDEIYKSLESRSRKSLHMATRPELRTFLSLMDEVRNSG